MIDPNLDWQIHCIKYRVPGHSGMQEFPRYFVTLNGKIILLLLNTLRRIRKNK